ncbi:hypothetical protein SLEP1_g31418 [Rubroshorea leprosula]|uniref:Uncharacterized protein n=1 Tax=Rubroshorea leprosula TaxID=152421 RepID=A0AAV5K3A2_9ROSI|nr:hypothetical protein SLEP1_g31418 [Rubroshorea leprosula]
MVLLYAARIAMSSMSKTTALSKEEVERKVREATCASKQAQETLEHLIWVSNEENGKNDNNGVAIANAKDEEEMGDGNFESLIRHLENTLGKEEV